MAARWTDEQKSAIDLRKRNILVSAAAGSGKTAVLVERIFAMLTDPENPLDIDQLLVVTFTNAAAAEMKERVEDRLMKCLDEDPDNDHVHRQLASIHSAKIMTIHSFCLYVIRNHFNEIDLDPAFRIGEETELKLMRGDVAKELMEARYEAEDPAFTNFVECFALGKMDSGIEELIVSVYEYSRSYPWPEEWLEDCLKSFAVSSGHDLESLECVRFLKEYVSYMVREVEVTLKTALKLCQDSDGPVFYEEMIASDLKLVDRLKGCESLDDYYEALADLSFAPLSRKRMPDASEEKKTRVKALREFAKNTLTELKESFFGDTADQMAAQIHRMYPAMAVLVDLVKEFSQRYQKAKEEKTMVDFGDLEHFALQILIQKEDGAVVPTEAAGELSAQFEEILIDEYQDSNQVQETILTSISRERTGWPNIFMVGDVKQSIYKFRLAKPELFMEKYASYELKDSMYQRIDLHKNFRSRGVVLEAVNFLFRRMMAADLGGIEYDDDAALYTGAKFPPFGDGRDRGADGASGDFGAALENTDEDAAAGTAANYGRGDGVSADAGMVSEDAEVILVNGGDSDAFEDVDQSFEVTSQEMEARAVALRIHELVDGSRPLYVVDKTSGQYRRACYGDIVILLRTMAGWADTFVRQLNNENIPAQAETVTGFFSATEVRIVLSCLEIVDNPRQDIPLAAVLHSPMGGFDDEALAMIRSVQRHGLLYDSCTAFLQEESTMFLEQTYAPEAIEDVRQRLLRFMNLLDELREQVPFVSVHQMLLDIYEKTGYYAWIGAMPGGQRRQANLDMLVEKAVAYETTSYRGLFNFSRYMDKLKQYEVDFGEAFGSDGFENTVRIMSIHKSKGLEYPVVFVSGLGKSFNQQDARSSLIIHSEYGFGPDAVDPDLRLKAPTLLKKILAKKTVLENLGEELRVLYVALTRAKEKLIMTGYVKDMDKALERWTKNGAAADDDSGSLCRTQLSFGTKVGAGCFLDWIMSILVCHHSAHELLERHGRLSPIFHPDYDNRTAFLVREMTVEEILLPSAVKSTGYMLKKDVLEHWNCEKVYIPEMHEQMERLLLWDYPFASETQLHTKMSVTELKRLRQLQTGEEEESEAPVLPVEGETGVPDAGASGSDGEKNTAAAGASGSDGEKNAAAAGDALAADGKTLQERMERAALRGTTVHRILEKMDISKIRKLSDVYQLADEMVQRGQITALGRSLIYVPGIYRFARSSIAARMEAAAQRGQLYREKQFVIGVPPEMDEQKFSGISQKTTDAGMKGESMLLIQGIIDAWFIEDGEAVIVDYKTDYVADDGESLVKRYKVQLEYYALAIEQMTGLRVREKIIYSLGLSKELRV